MKKIFSLLLIILISLSTMSQGTVHVKPYYMDNFVFSEGYWVYRDTVNGETDSITLSNCTHGYIYPTPIIPDFEEFYLMDFYSHTYDDSYNEFIITRYWKRNGGGQYGQFGQPLMEIGKYKDVPEIGNGFNGFEIIDIIGSYEVNGVVFHDVVLSRVYAGQQYQNEFEYDTDLYFAPGVGIIRKTYFDDSDIYHVWDLVNWEVDILTDINEDIKAGQKVSIYPNPAHEKLSISVEGLNKVFVLDIKGQFILQSVSNSNQCVIDIHDLAPGIYITKVHTDHGILTRKIITY